MARTPAPTSALRSLWKLTWRAPLMALPFAAFFNFMQGISFRFYGQFSAIALVFSFTIALAIWIVSTIDERSSQGRTLDAKAGGKGVILVVMRYMGASLFGMLVASTILHFTLLPGMLGSLRSVSFLLIYGVLFSSLFMGISFAFTFYEHAMARVRSEEELNLARRIQRQFLISNFPQRPGLEVHALNVSSKEVSGDFYDVVAVGESGYLLCIADVSGKGVPAALLGSMLQASLRTQAPLATGVAQIVANINRLVCDISPAGQFATLFLGHVDESTMRFTYVNAGHNPPALLGTDGSRRLLEEGGTVVGVSEFIPYVAGAVDMKPGDRIVFYTDGLSEGMNAKQEMYGDDQVVDFAAALPARQSPREQIDAILADLTRHLGGVEPQDDITVMVLRVREVAS